MLYIPVLTAQRSVSYIYIYMYDTYKVQNCILRNMYKKHCTYLEVYEHYC